MSLHRVVEQVEQVPGKSVQGQVPSECRKGKGSSLFSCPGLGQRKERKTDRSLSGDKVRVCYSVSQDAAPLA